MFNLLVSGSGWRASRDTFPRDRVFEFTSDALKERFAPDGKPNFDALINLPTLFMPENGATSNDVARVGTINRITDAGKDYALTYTYDSAIPPLPNGVIEHLASELAIGDWEFTRTHWAVKDVDLFYALLVRGISRPRPKVFNIRDEVVDDHIISVMMPFAAAFDDVFTAIGKMAEGLGLRCQRADDIWKHDAIIQDVVQLICISRIVICDLSGKNSNWDCAYAWQGCYTHYAVKRRHSVRSSAPQVY